MKLYKADIHIHSILSPCGDLSMSPERIVERAMEEGLSVIGIADHNSTRQAPLVKELAAEKGIYCLLGCELTTKEEAHCLAFFDTEEDRLCFQAFLDEALPDIPNDIDKFGYQIVINGEEEIIYEEAKLLLSALPYNLDQLYEKVLACRGLFIPAHIDKKSTSLSSQLGFVPPKIKAHALEISQQSEISSYIKRFAYLKNYAFIKNSDAHIDYLIGSSYTFFELEELSFSEIKMALEAKNGRRVVNI